MAQWNYQYNQQGKEQSDFTALLEGSSTDELHEFMENEDKINEIVLDHEKIRKLKLDKELIQASNRSIADDSITKQPKLEELRGELAQKYEQLKDLNETFQMNQAKLDSLHKDVNLETMLAVLQTTNAETEEDSEKLAESFFAGDLSLSDFLANFKAKRTLAHTRRIKTEKMRELVLEVQRNPPISSTSAPPVAHPRSQPTPTTVQPYPGGYGSAYPASYGSQHRAAAPYPPNAAAPRQSYPYNWS